MARILVIDDDVLYREMIQEALVEEGYETIPAENGRIGLDRARAYVPDVIVCDVVMEGMDGYELLTAIRNDPTTASIPFIMITGWSSKGRQRQGMSLGADDFLAKPFNATELCDAVRTQLAKKERISADRTLARGHMDRFAASMLAAEIHDPVQSILGFTQILNRTDAVEIRHMARHMERAALRIRKSVDNVLLYAELMAMDGDTQALTHLRAQTTPNVGRLVEARTRAMAAAFGRESDLSVSVSSGNAAIGRTYMVRVIDELTSNAFMFSEAGTPVTITAAFSKDRFGLSVTDRGRGMSADQLGALNAFMQFDRMESGQPGLGLGLAIVRRIASLHGGALLIRSQLGEKTRASVELPRRSHA